VAKPDKIMLETDAIRVTSLSRKPGNVRELDNCQGNVRELTKGQGNVREELGENIVRKTVCC